MISKKQKAAKWIRVLSVPPVMITLLAVILSVLRPDVFGKRQELFIMVLLLVYLVGLKTVIPCAAAAGLIVWSSLTLKRHTKKELMGGVAMCGVSFAISLLIIAG